MGIRPEKKIDTSINHLDDGVGARKRVFIPGYSGVISRINETSGGTFAQNSRDSHYLVYRGCKPQMDEATLPSPDEFYSRTPNARIKTNAANRSNFTFGDERDWNFETTSAFQFRIPTKIPPRHASIMPPPENPGEKCSRAALKACYDTALTKVGIAGVKRLELAIRSKIDQRTTGGPMALRKSFKFFDTDGSGDIDPDEFYAAMHAFGLEFTEDQVLALFGYYDVDADGALSYYEFIDKLLESGFGLDGDAPKKPPQLVQLATIVKEPKEVRMKTVIRKEDLSYEMCKEMFHKFDANSSGEIDLRELEALTRAMGLSMSRETLNNSMFELDTNRNGAISLDEFWNWWQGAAISANQVQSLPMTGGHSASPTHSRAASRAGNTRPRPVSQGSMLSGSSISRPGSQGLGELKGAILGEIDNEYNKQFGGPSKGFGKWITNNQPAGAFGGDRPVSQSSMRSSRPGTRNSIRSVAGQDYAPPPLLTRPPKIHALQSLRAIRKSLPPRPNTAPVDMFAGPNLGFVPPLGEPTRPAGVHTAYGL